MPLTTQFTVAEVQKLFEERGMSFTAKSLALKLGCQLSTSRALIRKLRSKLYISDYDMPPGKGCSSPVFTWRTKPSQKDKPSITSTFTSGKQREDHAWKRKFDAILRERDEGRAAAETISQRYLVDLTYQEKYEDLMQEKNNAKELRKKRNRDIERINVRVRNGFFKQEKMGVNLFNAWNPNLASNDANMAQEA